MYIDICNYLFIASSFSKLESYYCVYVRSIIFKYIVNKI